MNEEIESIIHEALQILKHRQEAEAARQKADVVSASRCANCKHFYDSGYSIYGRCNIDLPPWVAEREGDEFRSVNRNYVCDLHKPKEAKP